MPTISDSRARALFESFTGVDRVAILHGIPKEIPRRFEDEHLDFKNGRPQDETFDEIWSKELGAFANNAGGVIVWGIKADRDSTDKMDYAHSLSLVPDVDVLKAKLGLKYKTLTDPSLQGVEIVAVPLVAGGKEGFVVCYIPEGKHKAYQSKAAKFPYYIRTGGDAVPIQNGMLRTLFYPQTKSEITLSISTSQSKATIHQNYRLFKLELYNEGPQTIEEPCVALFSADSIPLIHIDKQGNIANFPDPLELSRFIHPNMQVEERFAVPRSLKCGDEFNINIWIYQRNRAALTGVMMFIQSEEAFLKPGTKGESLNGRLFVELESIEE